MPWAAAALPLTSLTAWELLFDRLRLPQGADAAGRVLLLVAGAGGVGSMLLQLARQLTGLTLVATASQPDGQAWARHCGAHQVIDHQLPLRPQLEALGIDAVQWVASLSHTDQHFDALVDLLAPQGALALISGCSGIQTPSSGRLFLGLPLLSEPFNLRTASESGEVAGRPKVCATGWQLRELLAQHPTADALEVVYQRKDRDRRRVLDQQVTFPYHQPSCSPRLSAPTARHPFSLRRPKRLRASAPVQRRLSFFAALRNKD